MTSLPPPRPSLLWQPRDYKVWDANRDRIYEYYLVRNYNRDKTKRLMEEHHGFPELSKATWEHVLRVHFKFRKNLDREDWAPIGQHLARRRRLGKNTYAIDICGIQLPRRRVEKNLPRDESNIGGGPELSRDILVRTPPPDNAVPDRALRRRMYMLDLSQPSASDTAALKAMLPDWILQIRMNSPFNQTMLRLPLYRGSPTR
ncbi:hypothetical protein PG987_015927 [Apiospora arundinis]